MFRTYPKEAQRPAITTLYSETTLLITKVNKEFVIRLRYEGERYSELIGSGQYHKRVGQELAEKHFNKALDSLQDRLVIQLRRGLTVTFVSR